MQQTQQSQDCSINTVTTFTFTYKYEYIRVVIFCAVTNMNTFDLTFFGKYKYEHIWIPFYRGIQIRIYSGLSEIDKCEYKFDYSEPQK